MRDYKANYRQANCSMAGGRGKGSSEKKQVRGGRVGTSSEERRGKEMENFPLQAHSWLLLSLSSIT